MGDNPKNERHHKGYLADFRKQWGELIDKGALIEKAGGQPGVELIRETITTAGICIDALLNAAIDHENQIVQLTLDIKKLNEK